MAGNLSNNTPIQQTLPSTTGKPRVDLVKSDFDVLVRQKGYDVYHDKAFKCPCSTKVDNQALPSCKNCGGSGYIFVNRTSTKMVIQSMNLDTKFKDWSKEKLGSARITAFNEQRLSFMDRITVLNALMTSNELLQFKQHTDGKWRAYCRATIKEVYAAIEFVATDQKHKILTNTDYVIVEDQWIELTGTYTDAPTVSIRYEHHPQYHIIDLVRGTIESYSLKKKDALNRDESDKFPVSAVGRLSHYVLDQENFGTDYLFDNSFSELNCD